LEIQKIELNCNGEEMPSQMHKSWIIPQEENDEESIDLKPYESSVMAFIIKFLPRTGRLNAEKCVDFGVPPGPLFGKLKAGQDITLPDGTIVRSSDVMGEDSSVSRSIVLEVPHTKYLDSLFTKTEFLEAENVLHVFHFSPLEVVSDPRFMEWLKQFDEEITHVFLNESCSGMGLTSTRFLQEKLRLMNKNIFVELTGASPDPCAGFEPQSLISNTDGIQRIEGKMGLRLNVRPEHEVGVDMDEECMFDQDEAIREAFESADELEELSDIEDHKRNLNMLLKHSNSYSKGDGNVKKYPELTVLGSASAMPGKYRNNSSYLVEVKKDHFIILDCGEGTLNQLCRLKGEEDTKRILRNLKAIYISHQHADHHLGSINLLIAREETFQHEIEKITPLYLVVTDEYRHFLCSYHQNIQPVLQNVQLIKNEELIKHTQKDKFMHEILDQERFQFINKKLLVEFLLYTSLSEIETCRALHCRHAFCVTIKTEEGFKITYSGDTRPITTIVRMGKGSDLLIHEATMDHSLLKDAIIKKHSTFTEAIQIGRAMEAKFILLTHFSARYAKFPLLDEIENEENVGIAFDNMVLRPDDYQQIRLIYPALKVMFQKELEDMQDRSEKNSIFFDSERYPDYNDSKDKIISQLNQKYEEKLEHFKKIQQTKDKKRRVSEAEESRIALPEGVSSLASKINPALLAIQQYESPPGSPPDSPPKSPPRDKYDPWYQKPKQIKKQMLQAKDIHDKLLKLKSKGSSGPPVKNIFRKRSSSSPGKISASPQRNGSESPPRPPPSSRVKRSLSPPSPSSPSRAKPSGRDVSERLIKVAKK